MTHKNGWMTQGILVAVIAMLGLPTAGVAEEQPGAAATESRAARASAQEAATPAETAEEYEGQEEDEPEEGQDDEGEEEKEEPTLEETLMWLKEKIDGASNNPHFPLKVEATDASKGLIIIREYCPSESCSWWYSRHQIRLSDLDLTKISQPKPSKRDRLSDRKWIALTPVENEKYYYKDGRITEVDTAGNALYISFESETLTDRVATAFEHVVTLVKQRAEEKDQKKPDEPF